jgi:hypothetical protein
MGAMMTNGGQRSEIRGQLYSVPVELKLADCLEIWKRLNGHVMTVAEKELYEAVCRRLQINLAKPLYSIENAPSNHEILTGPLTECPICHSARVVAISSTRMRCKACDSPFEVQDMGLMVRTGRIENAS